MRHDLVDEFQIVVYPLIRGRGKRLFKDGGPKIALELVDSKTTSTGGLVLTYRPESKADGNRVVG
jgi:dihydrofolate reductase